MMAKNSIVEATRLLLHSSAKVYYRNLSEDAKAAVCQSFFDADTRGEGRISFHDFFDTFDSTAVPGFSWKVLFSFLDADNNGFLELDEFITLYYMNESNVSFCNSCSIPFITGGFSCTECPPPGRDSFDVCLSCYASPTPAFRHHHPRMSFVNLFASNYRQSGSNCNSSKSEMPSSNSMTRPQAAQTGEFGSMFMCDCCGTCIVTDRYTCKECVSSFDLCLSCYDSPPSHFHHVHPYSSFLRRACSQASAAAAINTETMAAAMIANAAAEKSKSRKKLMKSGIDLVGRLVGLSIQAALSSN